MVTALKNRKQQPAQYQCKVIISGQIKWKNDRREVYNKKSNFCDFCESIKFVNYIRLLDDYKQSIQTQNKSINQKISNSPLKCILIGRLSGE